MTTPTIRAKPHILAVAIALGLTLPSPGCSPAEPASAATATDATAVDPAERARARALLVDLAERFGALDPLLTSDQKDVQIAARETLRKELRGAGVATSVEAEALYHEWPAPEERARAVLLEIAAHGRPEALRGPLVEIVRRYDPELGLHVRTEAARILAETSPVAAEALLRELVQAPPNVTLPPIEMLLRYWDQAAHAIGTPDAAFLADLTVDFERPADLRYAAIKLLGKIDHPRSRQALRVVLVESGSDGYLRRKAAQALVELLPPEEACPILLEVADRESNVGFLQFLASLIERLCP